MTPPATFQRNPSATQQLFAVLHGQRIARHWRDKLLGRPVVISFEIASTKAGGIRYLVQVDKKLAGSIRQAIVAYIPDMKVTEVSDYLPDTGLVQEFKQTGHYVFPLAAVDSLQYHDPLGYITNALAGLSEGELMSFQLVLKPVRLREAQHLTHRILGNENILHQLQTRRLPLVGRSIRMLNSALFAAADLTTEVHHGTTKQSYQASQRDAKEQLQIAKRQRPARTLSAFELELMESMHQKVRQPLFAVNIRLLVSTTSDDRTRERVTAFRSALDGYSVPAYQQLRTKARIPGINRYREFLFRHRLPTLRRHNAAVLSASEVGSLYHFPDSSVSKTDNLVTSLSHSLPAPLSLKRGIQPDVVIGESVHHGQHTPIGLTEKERERHMYVIGGTGNGKTTMLQYSIVQDMNAGKGLAVIDPHGDMAETLLRHVPKDRMQDVIYFNPDDLEYPIGLNLLELTPGLTGNDLLREKDLITESVVSVFRKIFSEEDTGGHRIEYVLRNTVQTALTVPDATLFTVFDLLNDNKYRKSVIKTLEDKNLINFWKNELGKAGDMQKVKMAAGITTKIGRFLFSASARQILEQPKSTINFDDIINSGKILICNFSKGLLGEDTSELFGITVLAKLQLASLRRARLPQSERRAFFLYVDEFQNFATQSFVQMLSESRKYKLFMVMAEQSTSQQKDQQMVSIILANVGTVICFRTGNPQDEQVLLPLFSPNVAQGEISNLPSFNFYAKLSATHSQEPLSGETVLLTGTGSKTVMQVVIETSRRRYARLPSPEVSKPREIEVNKKTKLSPASPKVKAAKKRPKKDTVTSAKATMVDF